MFRMFLFCLFVVLFKLNESQILFSSLFFFLSPQSNYLMLFASSYMPMSNSTNVRNQKNKNRKWQAIHWGGKKHYIFGFIWFIHVQHSKKKYEKNEKNEKFNNIFGLSCWYATRSRHLLNLSVRYTLYASLKLFINRSLSFWYHSV